MDGTVLSEIYNKPDGSEVYIVHAPCWSVILHGVRNMISNTPLNFVHVHGVNNQNISVTANAKPLKQGNQNHTLRKGS